MQWNDTPAGYGWISIILHWLTAVIIIVLLFSGSSIDVEDPAARTDARNFHTSIGISWYVLLLGRIIWRAFVGHPGPNQRQQGVFFVIGKWVHYVLLVALLGMLLSGPAMAWASGTDIVVFDWFQIPAAANPSSALRDALHVVHGSCAIIILVGVVLHIGGVYKHTAFNHDGTLVRIIVPTRE